MATMLAQMVPMVMVPITAWGQSAFPKLMVFYWNITKPSKDATYKTKLNQTKPLLDFQGDTNQQQQSITQLGFCISEFLQFLNLRGSILEKILHLFNWVQQTLLQEK